MKTLGTLAFALFAAGGLSAQIRGGFNNVVYPGGTSATNPAIQRSFGNVAFPGGGGPHPARFTPARRRNPAVLVPYAYPVYVGGYNGYYDGAYAESAPPPAQQQQPNITVVYPPQPAPVIINQFGDRQQQAPPETAGPSSMTVYQPSAAPASDQAPETDHYLIAFNDHTIYSAVAYYVDGDTLHYFTAGNTHNQASLSLVDRELTQRLNKESGIDLKLPAAK